MATKKPAAKATKPTAAVAVVEPKKNTVALPGDYMAKLMAHATADKAQTSKVGASGGNRLSFKGATISLGGKPLGNQIPVIFLKVQAERTYYANEYDPNVISTPTCYSYDMNAPHEKSSNPESDSCSTCPKNEWGSAARGKGKACKEGMRAALVSAEPLDSDAIAGGQMVMAGFSVLNSKDAKAYVEAVTEKMGTVARVVTMLGAKADPNRQILNTFSLVEELPDELLPAVASRLDEAERMLTQPFPEMEAGKAPPASAGKVRRF